MSQHKCHFRRVFALSVYSSNTKLRSRIRLWLGILDSDISEKPPSHNFITLRANWGSLDESLPYYEEHELGALSA